DVDARMPDTLHTDSKRLQQVLRNLLSNAFKFTEHGGVTLRVGLATEGWNPENDLLNRAPTVIVFSVSDTGIGIPVDKHQIIFEAFRRAEGSTSRKYGGTGLGLAISREIARVLGGEIAVVSAPNMGSTFKLYVPQSQAAPRGIRRTGMALREEVLPRPEAPVPVTLTPEELVRDDRAELAPNDRVLLVVEDDPGFAQVLVDAAHARGFKAVVAACGAVGMALARELHPHAITLDIRLPDITACRLLTPPT